MGKLLLIKTAPRDRAALIDEYGAAAELRDRFAPTEKRYHALREEINSWCPEADLTYTEKGARYMLAISTRAVERKVGAKEAYKALGLAKFLRAASVSLKALGEFLSAPDIDRIAVASRTGSRTISATPIIAVPRELAEPRAA